MLNKNLPGSIVVDDVALVVVLVGGGIVVVVVVVDISVDILKCLTLTMN